VEERKEKDWDMTRLQFLELVVPEYKPVLLIPENSL
jgi:hypothetical protein